MPKRRWLRFVLEVVFLVAVAAALTVADLRPAAVVGMMAAGWFIVALFEWAVWLDEPHFGRGLPPRFYVPDVALPPPLPIDQARSRYSVAAEDDAPTWIASPADWGGAFDEWPVLDSTSMGEETEIVVIDAIEEAELIIGEPQASAPALPQPDGTQVGEPEPELDVEPVPKPEPEPEPPSFDEVLVPLPPVLDFHGSAEDPVLPVASGHEPEREPALEPVATAPPPLPAGPVGVIVPGVARHRVDPLAVASQRGGLFRRRGRDEAVVIEIPDGPPPGRSLPGRARRPD